MKGTETFKKTIEDHLNGLAKKDELFAETMKKPKKNIDDCITHILNQVKESGSNGFADEEIFGMAVHYYDEDNIKPGAKISSANVVVNHQVELTEKEKEAAKQKAINDVIAEQKERMTKRRSKSKEDMSNDQNTLFS